MLLSQLSLYLYQVAIAEILLGCIYSLLENQGTITLASLRGNDSADAWVLQLCTISFLIRTLCQHLCIVRKYAYW